MSTGLATTFDLLGKTENEAAVRAMLPALDSPYHGIQEGALLAILARRSVTGGHELLRRLHSFPPRFKEIVRQQHGRMTQTLRDAILGADRQTCLNGCQATLWFREYDLVPALLRVAEDASAENNDITTNTLMDLIGQLYDELAGPRDYSDRRDPQLIRRNLVAALEGSVKQFGTHKRREIVEAFLLLVRRDNVTLKRILQDPHHVAFLTVIDLLTHSDHGGTIRLLLSFLDDLHAPSSALTAIGKRTDLKFVRYLLHKVGREPANVARQNLKRVKAIAWLGGDGRFLDRLDAAAQHGAVRLVMTAGIPREEAFVAVRHLLRNGQPAGRREAANALAEFSGDEANRLALKALEDPDPQVQANIAAQLRGRGIPGALPKLIALVDSPHAVVRTAARKGLTEFSFRKYLGAFDMLDEEVRKSTGRLVKKVDPEVLTLLAAELHSKLRTRRLRGVEIARCIEVVDRLEEVIVSMLRDEDHLVRVEAAAALATVSTQTSRLALEEAMHDRSELVREAARKGLHDQISEAAKDDSNESAAEVSP